MDSPAASSSTNPLPSSPTPATVFAIVSTSPITYSREYLKQHNHQLPTQPFFKLHYACPDSVPFPDPPSHVPPSHIFKPDPHYMVEHGSESTFDPAENEEDWNFPPVMTFGIESEASFPLADPQGSGVPHWSVLTWASTRDEAEIWVKNKRNEEIGTMESKYGKKMGEYEGGVGTASKFQMFDAARRVRLFWVRFSNWGMMDEDLVVAYWAVVEVDVVEDGGEGKRGKKVVRPGNSGR